MKKINQILPWPIFKFRKTNFSYLFLTEWIESWTFVAFVRGFLFFSFIKSCFVLLILFASKTWIFVALSECAIPWISLTYTNKNHQSWRCNSSANSTHELMQKKLFFHYLSRCMYYSNKISYAIYMNASAKAKTRADFPLHTIFLHLFRCSLIVQTSKTIFSFRYQWS